MKPLSKGDTCRVRLHTGEVVEAVYDCWARQKDHYAFVNGVRVLVYHHTKSKPKRAVQWKYEVVNFVGNPCVLVPVGVSV